MLDAQSAVEDKDLPLREDIRHLGRLLGDTVRQQEGVEVFNTVERVRQSAIRFARDGDSFESAAVVSDLNADLSHILNELPSSEMIAVVRAFSYFLHLANIAEDQHHVRRRRLHECAGSPSREGSLNFALEAFAQAGIQAPELIQLFQHAKVSPVRTAHPTEVQRKSLLTCQHEIARLLDNREDRKSTRLNSSHSRASRMPSSA